MKMIQVFINKVNANNRRQFKYNLRYSTEWHMTFSVSMVLLLLSFIIILCYVSSETLFLLKMISVIDVVTRWISCAAKRRVIIVSGTFTRGPPGISINHTWPPPGVSR